MRNIWTICWRELKAYFSSPIPYVVGAAFLALVGYLFGSIIITSQEASLRSTFLNTVFLLVIAAPILTMRLLAEEQKLGTLELLLTSPVHEWQIVIGKYLGSLIAFAGILVALTLYYVLILNLFGKPDFGSLATSYIGILLLGGSFLAIGLFTSSLTQNQIVAGFLGIVLLLFIWLADISISALGLSGAIGDILNYLAIPRHFDNLFRGVLDTRDMVYALSWIAVPIFLATQMLQSRRWR